MRRGDVVAGRPGKVLAERFPPAFAGSTPRSHTAWRGHVYEFYLCKRAFFFKLGLKAPDARQGLLVIHRQKINFWASSFARCLE